MDPQQQQEQQTLQQQQQRRLAAPADYTLELFADHGTVQDVVRGVLHFIFFHRFFPVIRPSSLEVLNLTLPYVPEPELVAAIDARVHQLWRQLAAPASGTGGAMRGQLAVQFFEKRRRSKAAGGGGMAGLGMGWFGQGKPDESEICWETWRLEITLATPRTETDQAKALRAMETTLYKTAMKIMTIVNRDKDHVPPIMTSETNPFPYRIVLNPRVEGLSKTVALH